MSPSKGNPSRIDLTKKEIIYFAHHVIQAIQCEWEGCMVTLNSWDTLAKHLLRHCSRVVQQDGMYRCSYSRCSGRSHSSKGALKTHVELSHLSRVALPCPARGCNEVFVRVPQLNSHFEQVHHDLLDTRVSLVDLAPLSILSLPHRLRSPPPLSREQVLMGSVLTPVTIPPMHPGYSQASASQGFSRKWSRLNVQDESDSDGNPIVFDDLSHTLSYDSDEPPIIPIEVQRKLPLLKQPLLSRPQPKIHPRIGSEPPEQAILYPSFVHMVDSLVAAGTLAWHTQEKN